MNKNTLAKKLFVSTALFGMALSAPMHAAHAESPNIISSSRNVVQGTVNFNSPNANTLNAFQSSQTAIVNHGGTSSNAGQSFNIFQPNSQSLYVARDTSGQQTVFRGNINSNGRFAILNRNGTVFTDTSTVNVGSLIASTGDIVDADVMANPDTINLQNFSNASIVNDGVVTILGEGLAALVGKNVTNNGQIVASVGRVELVGVGTRATVDLGGDNLVEFALNEASTDNLSTNNSGTITAHRVAMRTQDVANAVQGVVNMDGVVNAMTVSTINGEIVLGGGQVDVAGTVTMNGDGDINVSSENAFYADAEALHATGNGNINITMGDGDTVNHTGYNNLQNAIDAVRHDGGGATTISLKDGKTYANSWFTIDQDNLTLQTELGASDLAEVATRGGGIRINANNVTLDRLNLTRSGSGAIVSLGGTTGHHSLTENITISNNIFGRASRHILNHIPNNSIDGLNVTGNEFIGDGGVYVDIRGQGPGGQGLRNVDISNNKTGNNTFNIWLLADDGDASDIRITNNAYNNPNTRFNYQRSTIDVYGSDDVNISNNIGNLSRVNLDNVGNITISENQFNSSEHFISTDNRYSSLNEINIADNTLSNHALIEVLGTGASIGPIVDVNDRQGVVTISGNDMTFDGPSTQSRLNVMGVNELNVSDNNLTTNDVTSVTTVHAENIDVTNLENNVFASNSDASNLHANLDVLSFVDAGDVSLNGNNVSANNGNALTVVGNTSVEFGSGLDANTFASESGASIQLGGVVETFRNGRGTRSGDDTQIAVVGNTFGDSVLRNSTGNFIQIEQDALFNSFDRTPIELDASASTFINDALGFNLTNVQDSLELDAQILDFKDIPNRGVVTTGFDVPLVEVTTTGSVEINDLLNNPPPADVLGLEPQSSLTLVGNDAGVQTSGNTSALDLAAIEPAAGGDDSSENAQSSCLNNYTTNEQTVTLNFGGNSPVKKVEAAGACSNEDI